MDFRTLGLEIAIVVAAEGSAFTGLTAEAIERQAEGTFFIVAIEQADTGTADLAASDDVRQARRWRDDPLPQRATEPSQQI